MVGAESVQRAWVENDLFLRARMVGHSGVRKADSSASEHSVDAKAHHPAFEGSLACSTVSSEEGQPDGERGVLGAPCSWLLARSRTQLFYEGGQTIQVDATTYLF